MTSSPIELGSVHLTESGLFELESCLESLCNSPEIEIQVKSNGFAITENSVKEILNHSFVESESLAYDIRLSCGNGDLRIVADSKDADEHLLYLDGDPKWERKAEHRITSLVDARKITWRTFIDGRKAIGVEVFGAIGLSSSLGLFLPSKMLHPVISWIDYVVLLISVVVLFAALQRTRIYPYFSVSFDGQTRYPDVFPLLFPVGFALGMAIGSVWL